MAESLSELSKSAFRGAAEPEGFKVSDTLGQRAMAHTTEGTAPGPKACLGAEGTTVAQCRAAGLRAQAMSLQSEHLEPRVSGFYSFE